MKKSFTLETIESLNEDADIALADRALKEYKLDLETISLADLKKE